MGQTAKIGILLVTKYKAFLRPLQWSGGGGAGGVTIKWVIIFLLVEGLQFGKKKERKKERGREKRKKHLWGTKPHVSVCLSILHSWNEEWLYGWSMDFLDSQWFEISLRLHMPTGHHSPAFYWWNSSIVSLQEFTSIQNQYLNPGKLWGNSSSLGF